jgi:CRISPR-associated endonuclease Csn1
LNDALKRVDGFFSQGNTKTPRDRAFIKAMKDRLRRTSEDEPIDNRSAESVGWMANELRHRIERYYGKDTSVRVFAGWVTASARRASGLSRRIELIGGTLEHTQTDPQTGRAETKKNRLDRRHHAIDAATIAMLRPGAAQSLGTQLAAEQGKDIAQILAIRDNLRRQSEIEGHDSGTDWKAYKGLNPALFVEWQGQMVTLADLIQQQLDEDRVPVFEFLRLRLGNSAGHEDTIRKLLRKPVGAAWSTEDINRSATPSQYVALTRQPDYSRDEGLPEDANRKVRVNGTWYGAEDLLEYFPTGAGCIKVRGGYAELGSSFHHARIYRCTKTLKSGKQTQYYAMLRVYTVDLLSHRGEDLFNVSIPEQSISRRAAEARLRDALIDGSAEYVGWVVPGDELLLDMDSQAGSGQVGELMEVYGSINRWVLSGFYTDSTLRLRPRGIASEGLPPNALKGSKEILSGKGWRPSIDVVFGKCRPVIIRRDILGRPRLQSAAHLPISWTTALSPDSGDDESR